MTGSPFSLTSQTTHRPTKRYLSLTEHSPNRGSSRRAFLHHPPRLRPKHPTPSYRAPLRLRQNIFNNGKAQKDPKPNTFAFSIISREPYEDLASRTMVADYRRKRVVRRQGGCESLRRDWGDKVAAARQQHYMVSRDLLYAPEHENKGNLRLSGRLPVGYRAANMLHQPSQI